MALFINMQCFGWGQKGHDVVAYIAETHLDESVKNKVEAILDASLVYNSNWLDNASHTADFAYTKTWHYKNIDEDQTFETAKFNKNGDIVTALNEQISKLSAGGLSPEEEKLALNILIHLMGDLHQPMHMGHYSDLGGNKHEILFFGRKNNLHSIWDSALVEAAHKWSYTEWQTQIDRLDSAEMENISKGTITDWAKETYELATEVYRITPVGFNVSYNYVSEMTHIIEEQFERGGIRLAFILNNIYKNK